MSGWYESTSIIWHACLSHSWLYQGLNWHIKWEMGSLRLYTVALASLHLPLSVFHPPPALLVGPPDTAMWFTPSVSLSSLSFVLSYPLSLCVCSRLDHDNLLMGARWHLFLWVSHFPGILFPLPLSIPSLHLALAHSPLKAELGNQGKYFSL